MSSFVSIPTQGGELAAIKYEAARVHHYGSEKQYSMDVPAYVSFRLGDARIVLTIEDARDLLEALPGGLAQHTDVDKVTDGSKAAA